MSDTVTTVTPIRPKDPTAAARSRRYRQRHRDAAVTVEVPDTIAIVQLAAKVGSGAATADDMLQAEQLLLFLVAMLPAA